MSSGRPGARPSCNRPLDLRQGLQLGAWSWSSLGRPEADAAPGRLVGDVFVPDRIFSGVDTLRDCRTRVLYEA